MHVCMFVRNAFTHDARVTREARALIAAGYRVTVLAVRRDLSLPAREERDGFTVERISVTGTAYAVVRTAVGTKSRASRARALLRKLGRTFSTLRFNARAARRAAELRPDVYHCNDFNTLLAGFLAARRAPAPVVYDSHELYAHLNVENPPPFRRWFVEAVERRLARRAAAVITVSDSFADHLARRYRIPRPTVVRNVPHAPPFGSTETAPPEPFGIDAVKVLYVGGVQRARGLEQSIGAMQFLPGAHLIVMGPSFAADEERLRKLAADLGLTDRVHFVPPVPHEDVTGVSSHATVGLIPFQNTCLSHYLTLPNKVFECLHAGLPIVASDFPEMRAIVEAYGCGRACDPSDPRAIAAAIESLTGDAAAYERARAGARRAATEITWPGEAEKLLAVYRRVAG